MIKLALIGDSEIQYYSVADRLWELISVVIDRKINFTVIPLATPNEVMAVFEEFQNDNSFVGFNIARPWRDVLADKVDEIEESTILPVINTVYKEGSKIIGTNSYPFATQLAAEDLVDLGKCKTALVIGVKETGLPIAHHLFYNLKIKTYLYDPFAKGPQSQDVVCFSSISDVTQHKYDLIVHATPLGRYFFDKHIEAFTSPLEIEVLEQISHKNTIIQETNYMPSDTLLLQMAKHLGLQVVTGDSLVVYEAAESLKRYFGITLDEPTIHMLVEEIGAYISEREIEILE